MDAADFKSAFELPFAKGTSFDTVVVGVLVTLASISTPLAGILLVGYVARLVRDGEKRATTLPSFDDFVGVSVEGARLSAVLVALQLPAVAITSAVLSASGSSLATLVLSASGSSLATLAVVANPQLFHSLGLSAVAVVGLVIAGVVALAGIYVSAAMAVAVAHERSLRSAVSLARTLALDKSFLPVVSATAFVGFGGRMLGALFETLPVVGVALGGVVSFLTLVAAATLLGRGASDLSKWRVSPNPDPKIERVGSA